MVISENSRTGLLIFPGQRTKVPPTGGCSPLCPLLAPPLSSNDCSCYGATICKTHFCHGFFLGKHRQLRNQTLLHRRAKLEVGKYLRTNEQYLSKQNIAFIQEDRAIFAIFALERRIWSFWWLYLEKFCHNPPNPGCTTGWTNPS